MSSMSPRTLCLFPTALALLQLPQRSLGGLHMLSLGIELQISLILGRRLILLPHLVRHVCQRPVAVRIVRLHLHRILRPQIRSLQVSPRQIKLRDRKVFIFPLRVAQNLLCRRTQTTSRALRRTRRPLILQRTLVIRRSRILPAGTRRAGRTRRTRTIGRSLPRIRKLIPRPTRLRSRSRRSLPRIRKPVRRSRRCRGRRRIRSHRLRCRRCRRIRGRYVRRISRIRKRVPRSLRRCHHAPLRLSAPIRRTRLPRLRRRSAHHHQPKHPDATNHTPLDDAEAPFVTQSPQPVEGSPNHAVPNAFAIVAKEHLIFIP